MLFFEVYLNVEEFNFHIDMNLIHVKDAISRLQFYHILMLLSFDLQSFKGRYLVFAVCKD